MLTSGGYRETTGFMLRGGVETMSVSFGEVLIMRFKAGTIFFGFLIFAFGGTAFASYSVNIMGADDTVLATVSSDSQILGYLDGRGFNETNASVFGTGNSGQDTETNYLNDLLDGPPAVTFSAKDDSPSADSFLISNRFFAVKFGNFGNGKGGTAFFEVLDPSSSIKVTFTKQDGSGLSHVTQFAAVPIPAAAWLFGSALLGLIGVGAGRRRTA